MSKIPVVLSSQVTEGRTLACHAEGQTLLLTRIEGCVHAWKRTSASGGTSGSGPSKNA